MITRRSLLRGLFAMPAVVVATNIMPVRSIERFIDAPSPRNMIFVHPRMFDDLMEYVEQAHAGIVSITGIDKEIFNGPLDPWNGDLRVVIKNGILGLDWPAMNVRVEKVGWLDVAKNERLTFPELRDGGHTYNISQGLHSHSWDEREIMRRQLQRGLPEPIADGLYDRVYDGQGLLTGEIGEFRGVRLVE